MNFDLSGYPNFKKKNYNLNNSQYILSMVSDGLIYLILDLVESNPLLVLVIGISRSICATVILKTKVRDQNYTN